VQQPLGENVAVLVEGAWAWRRTTQSLRILSSRPKPSRTRRPFFDEILAPISRTVLLRFVNADRPPSNPSAIAALKPATPPPHTIALRMSGSGQVRMTSAEHPQLLGSVKQPSADHPRGSQSRRIERRDPVITNESGRLLAERVCCCQLRAMQCVAMGRRRVLRAGVRAFAWAAHVFVGRIGRAIARSCGPGKSDRR
jgi:hypothetical protein